MPDRKLFILASILITIGILASYSLSAYTTILFEVNQFHFIIRQILFGFLGIFIIWFLSTLDPDKWLHPIGLVLFIGSLGLMTIMPFLPESVVTEVGGAKRWIKIVGFSLAPVEFFKVGFIYFLAWSFSRKMGPHSGLGMGYEIKRFLPYGLIFIYALYIIADIQKDLGQSLVLGLTLLILLIFAGSSFRFFSIILALTFVAFIVLIIVKPHRIDRVLNWWSGAQNTVLDYFPAFMVMQLKTVNVNEGYQIGNSLNAIYNGGLVGSGYGSGSFKLGFLSEVHTDFILAGIAEETGFAGILVIVILFLMLIFRILRVSKRTDDDVIHFFSLGIALILTFAFIINAYGISGIIPIKGISVPLLSYGGSVMIASSVAIGMILMITKKVDMR